MAHVLGGVVAGRPVPPQPVDERHVIGGDHRRCASGCLEQEQVGEALALRGIGEQALVERQRGHADRHEAAPVARRDGGAPYAASAPQSCPMSTASSSPPSVSCNALRPARARHRSRRRARLGRRVPAHERRHGAEARVASAGSRCRHVHAESGNPCRQSASGPLPASTTPNPIPSASMRPSLSTPGAPSPSGTVSVLTDARVTTRRRTRQAPRNASRATVQPSRSRGQVSPACRRVRVRRTNPWVTVARRLHP